MVTCMTQSPDSSATYISRNEYPTYLRLDCCSNMTTAYHAKYFAYELTKQCAADNVEKIAASLIVYAPIVVI
jgi:hypothetical protein